MPASRFKPLVDRFASEIRSGVLPAGTRLPTHRDLAAREGIALVTATRVYAELELAGLVSREQGRGTFVRGLFLPRGQDCDQMAVTDDLVDLNFNYPALPQQAEMLRQSLRELATSGDIEALLRYQPHAGRMQDRLAISRYLDRRGISASAERIVVVSGAQHGLAVALMANLAPGDVVAVDALTYPGFKAVAQALRLELAPVSVTSAGTDLDALERLCAARPVRAIYTMPTMHNPLGVVLDSSARRRLVDLARQKDVLLIEDAAYAYLVPDAPAPLVSLAPERTLHVSSLSKNIAAGLRVGYIVAPDGLVPPLERAIRSTTWNTPVLPVAIACRWLDDGTSEKLEDAKRVDAARRQAIARTALAGRRYVSHPNSYFVWLPLPEDARSDRIAGALAREHISVATAEPFATTTHSPQALRLALGSVAVEELARTLGVVLDVADLDATL